MTRKQSTPWCQFVFALEILSCCPGGLEKLAEMVADAVARGAFAFDSGLSDVAGAA